MKNAGFYLGLVLAAGVMTGAAAAAQITPAMQAKINAEITAAQALASDPAIVEAVKAQNASAPANFAGMTQEKWAAAAASDPFVQGFTTNAVAAILQAKKSAIAAEVFVNAADGRKVAFLAKTTNWSHAGSPKHDMPMMGHPWTGAIEHDHSSGVESIQIGVPVLDGGKAIGSIVIGLDVAKLK